MSSIPISPFLQVESKRRAVSLAIGDLGRMFFIATVACTATYCASTLVGQTALEGARRTGILAVERTRAAERAVAQLNRRIDTLESQKSIDSWAKLHGYSRANFVPEGSGHVARR